MNKSSNFHPLLSELTITIQNGSHSSTKSKSKAPLRTGNQGVGLVTEKETRRMSWNILVFFVNKGRWQTSNGYYGIRISAHHGINNNLITKRYFKRGETSSTTSEWIMRIFKPSQGRWAWGLAVIGWNTMQACLQALSLSHCPLDWVKTESEAHRHSQPYSLMKISPYVSLVWADVNRKIMV